MSNLFMRDYTERVKIGVVGVGAHCYRNILPCLTFLPVDLIAVCDINEDTAKKTAKQYGCEYYTNTQAMYEKADIEAVLICVSPQLHPKLVCEAFEAGLHVWVEKPVSMRAYEVEEMIKCRSDRIGVVGFKKAFMPVTEKAVEIAQSEKYGNLQSILGIYPMSIPDNGEKLLEEKQFINWLANGVHPLSFFLEVGGKVAAVRAETNKNGHGTFTIHFKSGIIGSLHLAAGPLPMENYNLYGEGWHLDIQNNNKVTLYHTAPGGDGHSSFINDNPSGGAVMWEMQNCLASIESKLLFTQGFYGELKYFCDCVLNGQIPVKGSLEFALELMKVYEAGLVSHGDLIEIV